MIKFNTFIDQKLNNSLENNFYEILTFSEYILKELENKGEIELVNFQRWKTYMNKYDNLKINSNKLDNTIIIEEIQKNKEKILRIIGNMDEYEFISDYFTLNENIKETEQEKSENSLEEEKNEQEKYLKIKESIEKKIEMVPKNLFELLSLTSKEFLKEKLNLDDEQIQNLKGKEVEVNKENEIKINDFTENINNSKENKQIVQSYPKLNQIIKIKSDFIQKNRNTSLFLDANNTNAKLDKEMEEEINKEIFSYTRNMKTYARNFGEILQTDNKKLTKIEKVQEKDKSLTDTSMKKLKEFHYDLKIGFFKLIIMFIIVIATFVTTMMVIRIFPKLVK